MKYKAITPVRYMILSKVVDGLKIPIGTIIETQTTKDIHDWLQCDGRTLPISKYFNLWYVQYSYKGWFYRLMVKCRMINTFTIPRLNYDPVNMKV